VWARELHKLLLGDARASYLYEDARLSDGTSADGGGAGAESVYMHVVEAAPRTAAAAGDAAGVAAWARALFTGVFHDEIAKRLAIAPDTYKTAAVQPRPLALASIETGVQGGEAAGEGASGTRLRDQAVLSLRDSAALLLASLARYYTDEEVRGNIGKLEFSKDSDLDLDFVTAATNLRAYTFGIPLQSRFDVKSIAGNIIPAIATTNAMVAGLQALEAVKLLRGAAPRTACAFTWVARQPLGGKLLLATRLVPPSSACYVCGKRGVTLFIDTTTTSLRAFIDKVLVGALAFNVPNIDNNDGFNFLEEREDGEDDDEYAQKLAFLPVPMADLVGGGLRDGMVVDVTDFGQDLAVSIAITHRAAADFDEMKNPAGFELVGADAAAATAARLDAELAASAAAAAAATTAAATATTVAAPAPAPAAAPAAGSKRSREEAAAPAPAVDAGGVLDLVDDDDDDDAGAAKRPRPAESANGAPAAAAGGGGDDDAIVVLDD